MSKETRLKKIIRETNAKAPTRESQRRMILGWLKSGNYITPGMAYFEMGCLRLSARIFELRDAGYNITTTMRKVSKNKRVAEYRLELEPEKK